MTPRRALLRGEAGFALSDLLVACSIMTLVMGAVLNAHMTGTTIALTGQNRAEAQQGARAVLQIEEDLRLAGAGLPPATTPFTAASGTSVTFWGDLTNSSTTLTAAANVGTRTLNVGAVSNVQAGDIVYLINQGTS